MVHTAVRNAYFRLNDRTEKVVLQEDVLLHVKKALTEIIARQSKHGRRKLYNDAF